MNENTLTVILLLLIVVLYMLPAVIAFGRDIPQKMTITVINLVFGWTLVVWIILFVWAMMAETAAEELA